MTTTLLPTPFGTLDDPQLVARCLAGQTEAFGAIVERYQSQVCALAYSSCGNVHVSEDLAQETFINAWRQLQGLREPQKLRGWLCGIARNVIHSFLRKEQRTPTANADTLDESDAALTDTATPADRAMSRQEENLLWQTLQRLPLTYREPMVLFYRQQESVAAVAETLGLSEDAVKQRLSRGRTLVTEQIERRLADVLRTTGPAKTFAVGVLATLPALAVSGCTVGIGAAAAKGSATAKAVGLLGWLNGLLGPLLAFAGIWVGYKASVASARSEEERRFLIQYHRRLIWAIVGFGLAVLALVVVARPLSSEHPSVFAGSLMGLVVAYVFVLLALISWFLRRHKALRQKLAEGTLTEMTPPASAWRLHSYERCSKHRLLGLPLWQIRMCNCAPETRKKPVKAWIAIGDVAVGGFMAFGGVAIAPISIGGCAIGLVPFGGVAVGWLVLGGFGLGIWAIGGFAIGYLAYGGIALGWKAAVGGLAMAHEYAEGGSAVAAHANDAASAALTHSSTFFQAASTVMGYAMMLNLLWLIPMALIWRNMQAEKR